MILCRLPSIEMGCVSRPLFQVYDQEIVAHYGAGFRSRTKPATIYVLMRPIEDINRVFFRYKTPLIYT
jgi:hypothetical protein